MDRQGTRPSTWWLIGAVGFCFVLWGGWWYLSAHWFGLDMETRGQLGDLFGGVNALFTGLAFAVLIYTIFLQRKELEMQREELSLSRNELRSSVEAQQGSQEALTKQVGLLEASSRLSAISTLIASYGRKLDNIAEDDQQLNSELRQKRGSLQETQDGLAGLKRRLEARKNELHRTQETLEDPQTTDPDNIARLTSSARSAGC
jgi:LIF / OSM family